MTAEAATWSERDLDHRFNVGEPYDEVRPSLPRPWIAVLDRLAGSLRHEPRFSAELSHELRTPLTAISAQSRARPGKGARDHEDPAGVGGDPQPRDAGRPGALEGGGRGTAESSAMRRTADAMEVAERAREWCAAPGTATRTAISVAPPRTPLRLGVDADAAEQIVAPVLENACRYGRHSVRLSVNEGRGHVEFLHRE